MIDHARLYEIIRSRIRALREQHPTTHQKTTQSRLAAEIGIERSTLTNIELGNQRPPLHVLYALCEYFGIDEEQLLPSLTRVRIQKEASATEIKIGTECHELPAKTSAVVNRLRKSKP